MKCSNGRVTAVVRSCRVPVGLAQFALARQPAPGLSSQTRVRSVIFDNVLDEQQLKLLEEARRLAEASCLDLEIVDLGKANLFQRALFRLRLGQRVISDEGLRIDLHNLSDIQTAFDSSIN